MRTIPSRCPKWIGRKKTIARGRAQTTTARSETGKRHTTTIPDEWPRPEAGGRFPSPGDALWWPGRRRRIGGGRHIPTRPGRPVPWPPGWGRGGFAVDAATGWGVLERTPAGRAVPEVPPVEMAQPPVNSLPLQIEAFPGHVGEPTFHRLHIVEGEGGMRMTVLFIHATFLTQKGRTRLG